jgi:MFS family permease
MLSTIFTRRPSAGLLRPAGLRRLVYGLFVVCGVAQSAIVPLLPHLSARYGLSASETALLLAVPGLATLAVSVPAGVAADRYGARRVTLAAGLMLCVSGLAQAGQSLALLMAGRVAFGIAFGVVWTTGVAWLAEIDDGAGRGRSARLGPSVTCSSVGVMFGPAVGGLLGQGAGPGLPFLLIAAVTAAVVLPLALGSTSAGEHGTAAAAPRRRRESRRAVLALAHRPGFGAAAGGLVVAGAVSGSSQLLITSGLHQTASRPAGSALPSRRRPSATSPSAQPSSGSVSARRRGGSTRWPPCCWRWRWCPPWPAVAPQRSSWPSYCARCPGRR